MPAKHHAKRPQRRKPGNDFKLDPKIFTDPVERAEAEAMLEKSVYDYGNEFFAGLVEALIKRGEMTVEEGEKRKKKFARQFKPKRKF